MTDLKPHEYANAFPMMTSKEYADLLDSIKADGYHEHEPIMLYNGAILDGRNRYRAALELNVMPMFVQFSGDDEAAYKYARSTNLARKHWSLDQLAAIGLDLMPIEAELARKRMSKGGKLKGVVNLPHPVEGTGKTRDKVAASVGVSVGKVRQAQAVAKAAPELMEKVKAGTMLLKEAEKQVKTRERKKSIEKQRREIESGVAKLPAGLFEVIVIDPPWQYGTKYDPNGRRAANPYPEMSLEQIAMLEIPAAENCIMWLWTTHKFMRYSFALLDGWGFRDVMIVTWVKDRMGLGTWLRSQSEFCIMAVKGNPVIELTNQTTIINGKLREHSRKPDEFYSLVDSLCVGRKIDYFSRENRTGWEQYGNDSTKF